MVFLSLQDRLTCMGGVRTQADHTSTAYVDCVICFGLIRFMLASLDHASVAYASQPKSAWESISGLRNLSLSDRGTQMLVPHVGSAKMGPWRCLNDRRLDHGGGSSRSHCGARMGSMCGPL
jgi:hypothetical protein